MNMDRWENKVAVVTGASSGIGAAIVKDLVVGGLVVIGLARRQERVDEIKSQLSGDQQKRLHSYKCDVSKLESVNEAFDWVEKTFGGVDILINNAGCYRPGQLCTMDVQHVQDVLQTNVMGIIYCTHRAFKSIKDREVEGHVVLMNSYTGHHVIGIPGRLPEMNIYPPSKFAITAISEIYRQEFSALDSKCRVTSISPGFVDTEIVPDEFKAMISDRILKSEDISRSVLFALSSPQHVQIHEMIIKPVGEWF